MTCHSADLQFAHGYSAIEAGALMTPMALGLPE